MFDLEKSIAEWRAQMLAAGIKSPVPLEELESHLRDEIERQRESGLNEQEAFEISVQQIGQASLLKMEFGKTKGLFVEIKFKIVAVVLLTGGYSVMLLDISWFSFGMGVIILSSYFSNGRLSRGEISSALLFLVGALAHVTNVLSIGKSFFTGKTPPIWVCVTLGFCWLVSIMEISEVAKKSRAAINPSRLTALPKTFSIPAALPPNCACVKTVED